MSRLNTHDHKTAIEQEADDTGAIQKPLNEYELISVKSLIAYIAHTQKLKPESLHVLLEMQFEAASVPDIKSQDFPSVVKYLVDLQDCGSLN